MLALSIATLLGRRAPAEVQAGFSPSELFANSEVGVWYDPSDFSTLFENTDGTGAISTVEKPVGKMLDKSGNGFHATAANNGTARPVLRSRYNLLTYSEQFDNAAWSKLSATITANAATAPDGTTTADKAIATNGALAASIAVRQDVGCVASTRYTLSIYAKASGQSSVDIRFVTLQTVGGTVIGSQLVVVDLTNGTYTTTTTGTPPSSPDLSVLSVGDGWYRIVISAITNNNALGLRLTVTNAVTGNGTDGVLIWGAQLVADSVFPQNTYQRIAAATNYDTDATKFPPYLAFTTDDAMSTASIDFSGTDEMSVFAGVTKNSDAAAAVVAELSATIASNNGTFLLAAPDGATATYGWDSKGTAQVDAVGTSLAAPRTSVLTGTADISADACVLRVNGVQADSDTGDQGSGNYANAALYIGARNNASLFFNGSLYSLIVRGKTSTATEITNTEAWVADKTGVTL